MKKALFSPKLWQHVASCSALLQRFLALLQRSKTTQSVVMSLQSRSESQLVVVAILTKAKEVYLPALSFATAKVLRLFVAPLPRQSKRFFTMLRYLAKTSISQITTGQVEKYIAVGMVF